MKLVKPYLIKSADELLAAFRSRDRKNVFIPKEMTFPVVLGHYLTWQGPSGARIYLVFKKPGWESPLGVSFRRDQSGSMVSPPGICSWCIHQGPSDQVSLLTVSVNSRRRVGIYLCRDLSCIEKLETQASLYGKDLIQMADKLRNNMARFCQDALELEAQ